MGRERRKARIILGHTAGYNIYEYILLTVVGAKLKTENNLHHSILIFLIITIKILFFFNLNLKDMEKSVISMDILVL